MPGYLVIGLVLVVLLFPIALTALIPTTIRVISYWKTYRLCSVEKALEKSKKEIPCTDLAWYRQGDIVSFWDKSPSEHHFAPIFGFDTNGVTIVTKTTAGIPHLDDLRFVPAYKLHTNETALVRKQTTQQMRWMDEEQPELIALCIPELSGSAMDTLIQTDQSFIKASRRIQQRAV